MLKIKDAQGRETLHQDDEAASLCLRLCGGGWTAAQTTLAMVVLAKLQEARRVVVRHRVIEYVS